MLVNQLDQLFADLVRAGAAVVELSRQVNLVAGAVEGVRQVWARRLRADEDRPQGQRLVEEKPADADPFQEDEQRSENHREHDDGPVHPVRLEEEGGEAQETGDQRPLGYGDEARLALAQAL